MRFAGTARFMIVTALLALPRLTQAANTIELFDEKHGYIEAGFGYDGLGLDKYQGVVNAHALWGKGLTDRLSAYLGVEAEGNEYFSDGRGGVNLGLIDMPFQTEHVASELTLEAGAGDTAMAGFYLNPGLELNVDMTPNRDRAGFYIDVNELLTGRDTGTDRYDTLADTIVPAVPSHALTPSTELILAFYVSFVKGQQLHVQFDQRFRHKPLGGERAYEIGGITLGYNVMITDALQLTPQVSIDIPQSGEKAAVGVHIGIGRW